MKVRNDPLLARCMKAEALDAVVAFSMENVHYLSGALFALQDNIRERLSAAGYLADGSDFLLCATNEVTSVEAETHIAPIESYVEFERSPIETLAGLIKARGLARARIGIETRYLMAAFFDELRSRLPEATLVAGDHVLEAARAIKTPAHIALITEAGRATERALIEACSRVHPGDSERDLATAIYQSMFEAGAEIIRHAVVTAGDNARKAHPYPSREKILENGDLIRLDIGGLFKGYGSDIARMAIVGEPSPAQRKRYDSVRGCVHHVGPQMSAGVTAAAVYAMTVDYYASVGVPGYKRDHVGHSLSILGGHDEPLLHARNVMPLAPGMVIALEPILRDDTGRRVTVEDTFLVEAGGARLLTDVTDTTRMIAIT